MTIKSQLEHFLPQRAERIPRTQLYMEVAKLFSKRSTCLRGQVGCVAVKDNRIICAGYNGAPSGMAHCLDVGCGGGVLAREAQLDPLPGGEMPRPAESQDVYSFPHGCTRSVHAEMNMVAYAARHGICLDECSVYCTSGPCLPCAQALVGSGVRNLFYEVPYRLPEGLELLDRANVGVHQYVG